MRAQIYFIVHNKTFWKRLPCYIDFTLLISCHNERPFKCLTPRWYFQELKSGWQHECYPSILLSGFDLDGTIRRVPRSLAIEPNFLALGLVGICTWPSHAPQDTTLGHLELRGVPGLTSLGSLSQSESFHYAMANLVLPLISPKSLHGLTLIFQAYHLRFMS